MNYSEQNSEPKSAKTTFAFFLPCKDILMFLMCATFIPKSY